MRVHWVSDSALHEAGHAVMARAFGVRSIAIRRRARRGNPGMVAHLAGLPPHALAAILLAGMAVERMMARRAGRVPHPSRLRLAGRGDLAFLRLLGIRVPDLERALDRVEEMLRPLWQEVLRTAVHIQRAWDDGVEEVLLAEDDPVSPRVGNGGDGGDNGTGITNCRR